MKTDIRKHVVTLAFLTALSPALADMTSPYGYCLHLMRSQFRAKADRLLDLMVGAGVGWYRAGIGWEVLGGPGATLDFTVADETIGKAEAKGIGYLPILHYSNPRAPEFLRDHPDEWCAYVTNCVSRYCGRISCWEVWNEVNIAPEIGNQMPPADYARFLKQTAAAIRRTDPSARITTSGFAGIPLDYVKALYEGGAKDAFDVVNVHPYCTPWRPEGDLDVRLERLRELMRDSGDGDKPVWITEIGAKRTKKGIQMHGFPAAALKAVDPARKHWKVLLVEDAPDRQAKIGELIRNELPACTVEVCDFRSLEARLAAGGVEALFFPLDCTYPADAMDAVTDYVARGGTLVDLGGYSMYQPCGWKRTGRVALEDHNGARDRARLRFDVRFKYNDKRYPTAVNCHATAALEPDGLPPERKIAVRKMTRQRYFVPDGLREGDEFIPLLAGRTKAGLDVCSAVLIRYRSDMKGNLVLGGWSEGRLEAITPAEQGLCVARTLGIAFAEGVEKVSWYSLATSGWGLVDPVRLSGDEEGYRAYGVFVRMRPAGSANVAGAWHDDARETYFPQWRRPEGGVAGMLWSVRPGGGRLRVRIRGNPVFSDHLGNAIPPPLGEEGEGELRLGERPIYFVGGSVEAMPFAAAAGAPHGLTCEYRIDPVGIDAAVPRLSWKLPEDVKEQSAYEIEADGWRSGRVVSSRQLDVEWGGSALATGRRVEWRVRVWDGEGRASAWSEPARFTMGVMREADWKAKWIGQPKAPAQAYERRFVLKRPVRRATLFITAAGFYEAWLNGRRIGDKVLDPSPTQFDKRILYSTYLLDGDLQEGENVLRVLVGHGWYDVRAQAAWDFNRAPWRDFPRMLAQLELEYEDGGCETITSDQEWTVASSPVLHDDIREGEIVRSHDVSPGAGKGAKTAPEPAGARLVAEAHPATKVVAEVRPEKIVRLGNGSWMVCFPANLAGWIRLRVSGQERDSVVTVRYDERVNDDFTPALPTWLYGRRVTPPPGKDVRKIDAHMHFPSSHHVLPDGGAFQTDRIICSGEDETYEPRFTYNGFRYAWISGWKGELRPEDVTGCVVATSFARTGRLESSDPVLNRLLDMVDRSYRSNFVVGFPTDCPHREKNGWTGDASMAGELAQYLYENTAGYEKWLADICDAQNGKGDIPGIVPTGGWGFRWGNGPGWDSALPVLSWHLYRYRGDRRILERTYPALVRYLSFTAERADGDNLVRHGLADWCSVEKSRVPTTHLTSSCFWYQAQRIAALMADVLGKDEDAASFADGAERTKKGFNRRFYRGGGIYEEGLQTAEAMPLAFGLVPSTETAAVRARLVEACERTGGHCDCGLFGTKYVFRELSEAGRTDLALRMIVNPTAPSFRAMADAGATTLWEHWSGRSSLNHIMFGDFAAWAYQYLAGVRLAASEGSCSAIPTGPCAFREFVLAPVAVEALDHVSAAVETPYGTVESAWRREGGRLAYDFRVPPGTTARVTPPWGGGTRTYGPGRWSVSQ